MSTPSITFVELIGGPSDGDDVPIPADLKPGQCFHIRVKVPGRNVYQGHIYRWDGNGKAIHTQIQGTFKTI